MSCEEHSILKMFHKQQEAVFGSYNKKGGFLMMWCSSGFGLWIHRVPLLSCLLFAGLSIMSLTSFPSLIHLLSSHLCFISFHQCLSFLSDIVSLQSSLLPYVCPPSFFPLSSFPLFLHASLLSGSSYLLQIIVPILPPLSHHFLLNYFLYFYSQTWTVDWWLYITAVLCTH